jgi:hypothetical protein
MSIPASAPLRTLQGWVGQQLGKPRLIDLGAADWHLVREFGFGLRWLTGDATHDGALLQRGASPAPG